jgi:hypothetical protein
MATARRHGLLMKQLRCAGREAPERRQPWTWLRDGTSLQSRWAEKTVERLRKPEDGTKRGHGILREMWTRTGDVAMRDETLGRYAAVERCPREI